MALHPSCYIGNPLLDSPHGFVHEESLIELPMRWAGVACIRCVCVVRGVLGYFTNIHCTNEGISSRRGGEKGEEGKKRKRRGW